MIPTTLRAVTPQPSASMQRNHPTPGTTESPFADRVLVLAPHYDDETIGCGGLLAQLAAQGADVRVLFLTDGSGGAEGTSDADEAAEQYSARRAAEANLALQALGVVTAETSPALTAWGYRDGHLANSVTEAGERLGLLFAEFRPGLVLVPSPLEQTPDHRAAFRILFDVLSRSAAPHDEPAGGPSAPRKARGAGARPELEVPDLKVPDLEVLAYEVNHPLYPDLLVDVTAQLPMLERALACYTSQLERHPYQRAALGMRAYRTLSLGPEATAAEAYRRIRLVDFVTHSLASLSERLGAVPQTSVVRDPVAVSLIVRTRDRPQFLREALESVAATKYSPLQVVLVNDGGSPPGDFSDLPLAIDRVELPQNLGRAAAANAGLGAAKNPWIGFLDDDDLLLPEHFSVLSAAAGSPGVQVAYTHAAVAQYELRVDDANNGACAEPGSAWREVERRVPYSREFSADYLLVDNFIPFHTLLIERRLLEATGPFDENFQIFEDWDLLIRLSQRAAFFRLPRVTCVYRQFRGGGHHALGRDAVDREAGFLEGKGRIYKKHASLLDEALWARVVTMMRREVVDAAETARHEKEALFAEQRERKADIEARDLRRVELEGKYFGLERKYYDVERKYYELEGKYYELEGKFFERERALGELGKEHQGLAGRYFDLEAHFHRLNGESTALRSQQERLFEELRIASVELERLYGIERDVRSFAEAQTTQVAAGYAEIERLTAIIREMEGTRAWRFHRLLQRGRS